MPKSRTKKRKRAKASPKKKRFLEVDEGKIYFIRKWTDGKFWVFSYNPNMGEFNHRMWSLGNGDKLLKAVTSCASFIAAEETEKGPVIAVGHSMYPGLSPKGKEEHREMSRSMTRERIKMMGETSGEHIKGHLDKVERSGRDPHKGAVTHQRRIADNPFLFTDDAAAAIQKHMKNNPKILLSGGGSKTIMDYGGKREQISLPEELGEQFRKHGIKDVRIIPPKSEEQFISIIPLKEGGARIDLMDLHFIIPEKEYNEIYKTHKRVGK